MTLTDMLECLMLDAGRPLASWRDRFQGTWTWRTLSTDGNVDGMKAAGKEFMHWEENKNTGTLTLVSANSTHLSERSPKHNLAYAAIMLALYLLDDHLRNLNTLRAKYGHATLLKCVHACYMRNKSGYEPVPTLFVSMMDPVWNESAGARRNFVFH
jgi:hypothetical protein